MRLTLLSIAMLAVALGSAMACSESEIHRQTVACYNQRIQNPQTQQECTRRCIAIQDQQREQCPSIRCKIVAGMKICT
ncbi:MAG: hypothetical protein QOH67_1766 [Hyphomicrobiales bacterium]|jgi:hypothetical protein|nr:hypothetical protein [Hyphomicrobiales bacterium]